MGVYHISGFGKSPGALTVPAFQVYLLQIVQQLGIATAKQKGKGVRKELEDSGEDKIPHP
jgi:hypothetical protein